jgi:AcrR family transcriptional regulator
VAYDDRVDGLRERTRRAMRAEISDTAMDLFLERGFDATTMDDVATATGISRRSLFRYFATKEDIVLGNLAELGRTSQAALEARPLSEPPWAALRAAFHTLIEDPEYSLERTINVSKMLLEAPSLRARYVEKHLQWMELLVPNITRRLGAEPGEVPDPRAQALVGSALACLDAATQAWVRHGGKADIEEIYDEVVAAVRG